MKKLVWLAGVLASVGAGAEDFITDFEYGQMLYRDPRGASCAACHGETGSGRLIGAYPDKAGHIVTLRGPDIRHATLEQIRESVRRGSGVMPRYFLTEKEIETIHAYLKKVNTHATNPYKTTSHISRLFDRNSTVQAEANASIKSAE